MNKLKSYKVTSRPEKINSSYGNWFVGLAGQYVDGLRFNSSEYFYKKSEAIDFINNFKTIKE